MARIIHLIAAGVFLISAAGGFCQTTGQGTAQNQGEHSFAGGRDYAKCGIEPLVGFQESEAG